MTKFANAPRHSADTIKRFCEAGYWNEEIMADYVRGWAEREPDRVALRTPDRDITFGEYYAAALRLANSLLGLGLRKGDVVGIQMPNVPDYLVAYLGVTMMGGVLATMHMPYRGGEMEPLLNHGKAKAVICTGPLPNHDAPATMLELKDRVATLQHVLVATDDAPDGTLSLNALVADGAEQAIADPPNVDDFCALCFTSGTSAAPKGVMRSYQTFASNARIFAPEISLTSDDVVMVAPPFTHVFGLLCANLCLYTGAVNLLIPLFTPQGYAERLINGRPSVVFSAPAHVAASIKAGLLDGVDLSSVRDVIIAGSVCPPDVAAALEKRLPNGRAGQLFGMTEVLLVMQTPLDAAPEVRHTSTGRCTNGIEARITSAEGDVLGIDKEGELEMAGYTVMEGYLDNPQANERAFTQDGWFKTGDLATIDADGNVVITGRVKDLINRGGIKINPTDIENTIMAHDAVMQAAVVPMPDDIMGEKACLFVTLAEGAAFSFDEMTAHLADNGFAKMKWPERLEIIAEMPVTPTRKIIKGELIARLG
jgi:acyl-CoA synthetase (AMP-forming)/AMP-acid ligase II